MGGQVQPAQVQPAAHQDADGDIIVGVVGELVRHDRLDLLVFEFFD
jgi:hypothetical protein